jgi:hypothetical protein
MNKNIQTTGKKAIHLAMLLVGAILFLIACNKDQVGLPEIYSVRSTNPEKADSTFTSAFPGNWIIVEGKNFTGLKAVYINEQEVYINTAYVSDGSVVLLIPPDVPTLATQAEVSNSLKMITNTGEVNYSFSIMINPPVIYGISNEMAVEGELITLYGINFYVIDSVIFPGGVIISSGFEVNETATTLTVNVPEGLTEGGPLAIKNVFGRAVSTSSFNDETGMICNFDNLNTYIWGSNVVSDNGNYPGARGQFNQIKVSDVGPNSFSWWEDGKCCAIGSSQWITPENMGDNLADWALKFELFVGKPWDSGCLLINPANAWIYTYRYNPWVVDGVRTEYKPNGWQTITIPFSEFKTKGTNGDGTGNKATSLSNIVSAEGNAEMTIMFINDAQQGVESKLISIDFGIDNIRVVKINN